jgi:uncharacterized membrane protein YgcG
MLRLLPALLAVLLLVASTRGSPYAARAGQDTGWTITAFRSDITIEANGDVRIIETIDVDFAELDRHGIFREIPVEYEYNDDSNRIYEVDVLSVTDAKGATWPYERSRHGANLQLKIGDPNGTVTGAQSYVITYVARGVLNAFTDHDELFWNVNGFDWPVPADGVAAEVSLSGGGIEQAACYKGPAGSKTPCVHAVDDSGESVIYSSDGGIRSGENLTIVAGIAKGHITPGPAPILVDRPENWWERNCPPSPGAVVASIALLLGSVAALVAFWWRHGRDRVYRSVYYLNRKSAERTRPLLYRDEVVVEYTPPDDLRPAQLGLILDERADTRDVTATIVDLAVRGYLKIEEKEKTWLFGSTDWHLTKLKDGAGDLLPFEATVLKGLFETGDEADLSDLKNEFYKDLAVAQKELYSDAMERRWFELRPDSVRSWAAGCAIGVAVAGAGLVWLLGEYLNAAIAGVPVVLIGGMLLVASTTMSKRTAGGSEALRRTLGFRLFIETAEQRRQEFNERAHIFAEYLPYAIVFGSVDKWARVFRDLDTSPSTQSWYAGAAAFSAPDFSRSLESFSSSVSGVIASTPGGSGGSGFSGGSSGGGGGGGGGGSW